MVDKVGIEIVEPVRSSNKPSENFRGVVKDLERRIPQMETEVDDTVMLDKILFPVMDWEEASADKVTPNELEALGIVQSVLGTVEYGISLKLKDTKESKRQMRKLQVEMQRQAVKLLLGNLDETGSPNETIVRSMDLVTSIFEQHLSEHPDRFFQRGLDVEKYFWQGVMGMTTAAQMFTMIGWEVGLPPIDYDIDHNVDLIVRNPSGDIYTVDVGAKTHGFGSGEDLYVIKTLPENHAEVLESFDITARIVMNVPPLKHPQSISFYDSNKRKSGTPSEKALERMRKVLG